VRLHRAVCFLMVKTGLDVFHDKRVFNRVTNRFSQRNSIVGISGMFVRFVCERIPSRPAVFATFFSPSLGEPG